MKKGFGIQEEEMTDQTMDNHHEWLLLGAKEKTKSILTLSEGLKIHKLIEIGSGTGAILETLDKHGFAEYYYAVEPSKSLFDYMNGRNRISRLVTAEAVPLHMSRLRNERYDLAILSHVIEHVEEPARLLIDALALANFVFIEIPLDGNVMGNFRAAVKRRITGLSRRNNRAGHIQFFSRSDIRSLVRWCGGEVMNSRLYIPKAQMRQTLSSGSLPQRIYSLLIYALSIILGEKIWATLYHGHYAVLIRRRSGITPSERSEWSSRYYYENAGSIK